MKFSGLALVATTVSATALNVRQIDVVTGVLDSVDSAIKKTDSAVKAWNGGDSKDLEATGASLISTIKGGVPKVDASKDLTIDDALTLATNVKALTATSTTLVTDLKAKKSAIEKAGKCKTAQGLVSGVNDASESLIKAVVAKVPEEAQDIADTLSAGLRKVLADANAAYKDCKDQGNGGDDTTTEPPAQGTTSAPPAEGTTSAAGGGSSYGPPAASATPTATTPGPAGPSDTAAPPPPANAAGALAPAGAIALVFAAALL